VPQAQFGPIKIPHGTPDEQFLYLSDILPTAYQAVAYANVPEGGTLAVLGLGPVGQFAARIASQLGAASGLPIRGRCTAKIRREPRSPNAARHRDGLQVADEPNGPCRAPRNESMFY
jgi:hypothetical protein